MEGELEAISPSAAIFTIVFFKERENGAGAGGDYKRGGNSPGVWPNGVLDLV